MNYLDFIVLGCYFVIIFSVAFYFIGKSDNKETTAGYFLGGRNLGWFVIGASLFSSNIGSEHLIGLAGAGAAGDFPMAQIEIIAAFMLLLLGFLFAPFYLKTRVYTMPEFLEKRYDSWARSYLSWLSIIGYVLTKISVTIAAGGIIFTVLLGIDFWTGAILTVVATGAYTVLGGLKAVVYTDVIQLFILMAGAVLVTYFGLEQAGGWDTIQNNLAPSYTSLWRSINHPDFPWTGIVLGAPILGLWYWCTDQFIVQRVLAAKNIDHAQKATIFAGFLKLLPLFIFVIPGIIAYSLSLGESPLITFPLDGGKPNYDAALPLLTIAILPAGIRGLIVAGLLAALMSSLSSVFNSCSTIFTLDIYKKYQPNASQAKLVNVGKIATAALVILGLLWIPLLKMIEGGLFQKLQSIQAYIAPPITAVFIFGLINKRLNGNGAKYSLLTGAILGSLRLLLEILAIELPGYLAWFTQMNFLHFALFLFALCTIVLFVVSYRTNTVFKEFSLNIPNKPKSSNIAMSFLLIGLIALIWIQFS